MSVALKSDRQRHLLALLKHCKNQGWCHRQKGYKLPQQNFHIHKIGMGMALKSD